MLLARFFFIPEAFIWYLSISCLFVVLRILVCLVKGALGMISLDLFVQFP